MPQPPTSGPTGGGGPAWEPPGHPDYVGPYHILQVLGAGGMGIVYVAEQSTPVRRRVAVKLMRAGIGSPEVVARFAAERQALAVMEHPGIARIFDGGVTEDGRPYFVMELVKGIPITEYCDREKLSTDQRLAVFMDVCHAVQHAHQKGIIHRDLKPSNVLVTLQDDTAVPKVIDFGIAKALAQRLTESTLVTQVGQAVGTPAYMSPEQAEATALDVDTRTDIYSLGVMLFELLVGRLPLDPDEMGLVAFMARLASRDSTPARPSSKLATLGDAASAVSSYRRTDQKVLERELRGDLDWIVMKAMDPDRSRRYETVNALVVDIQHYLKSEPVAARPPSTWYRLSRFARRNRTAVTAAALIVAALVVGLSVAGAGLVKARRAEEAARQEAATSQQVAGMLTSLFKVLDPAETRGRVVTAQQLARKVLDDAAARIRANSAAEPLVQAQVMETIGIVYREIGFFGEAQPLLEQAVAIRRRLLPPDDSALQSSILELGHLAQRQGRMDVADSLYRETLAVRERSLGRDNPQLMVALSSLGGLDVLRGRYAEAESLLTRALALHKQSGAPDDDDFAELLRNLGAAYVDDAKYSEAEPLLQQALTIYERLDGNDAPDVGRTLNNLGAMYYYMGKYDQAEQAYERVEPIFTHMLGANNPNIASININLAELDWRHGRYRQAQARLNHALDILHKSVQPGGGSEGTADYDMGNVLRDAGKPKEAEPYYQRALQIRDSLDGKSTGPVAEVLTAYAKLLRQTGRTAEAKTMETRAKAILDTAK